MSNYRRGGVLPAGRCAAGGRCRGCRGEHPSCRPAPITILAGNPPAPSGTAACPVLMAGTARSPEAGGMLQRMPRPRASHREMHCRGHPSHFGGSHRRWAAGAAFVARGSSPAPHPAQLRPPEQRQLRGLGSKPRSGGMLGWCRGRGSGTRCGCPARVAPASKAQTPPRPIPLPGPAVAAPLPRRRSARNALLLSGVPDPARESRRRERSGESFSLARTSSSLLRKPLPGISPGTCLPRRGRTSISPKLP